MIQSEEEKKIEKREQKSSGLWDNTKRHNIYDA